MKGNDYREKGDKILVFHCLCDGRYGLPRVPAAIARMRMNKDRAVGVCCCGKRHKEFARLARCHYFHDCNCAGGGHE